MPTLYNSWPVQGLCGAAAKTVWTSIHMPKVGHVQPLPMVQSTQSVTAHGTEVNPDLGLGPNTIS